MTGAFCCIAYVASGTSRRFAAVRRFERDRSEADMPRASEAGRSDENDPNVWSGRALQEGFVDLADVRSCINVSGF